MLRLIRPLQDFLAAEVSSGALLVAAAALALVWANSPWRTSYQRLWETVLVVGLGDHQLALDLRQWVNEGLMAVFFFVVGLEIKRELVEGELRDRRKAVLPAVAAVGGMAVPALLYLAVNPGGEAARGWGIPMATDIALALGVAALLGRWVPQSLRLFLLTLAIVDDIGAIAVIAIFYSEVAWPGLVAAVGLVMAVIVLRAAGVTWTGAYVGVGVVLWLALHEAGVHATMTGVALGLLTPAQPLRRPDLVDVDRLADITTTEAALDTVTLARQSVSVVEWLEHALHRWASFVIVPLFALANAGVPVGADALGDAVRSPVTYGVLFGLVVGKTVGVSVFAWVACRSGLGALPAGVSWRQVVGIAGLAGIGLTLSIFVTGLAFDDPGFRDQATVGILAASLIAAALGTLILLRATAQDRRKATP
ncbi:MAG: Na+/H+ antiporter NhaA [Egibacteraceae bacterium]